MGILRFVEQELEKVGKGGKTLKTGIMVNFTSNYEEESLISHHGKFQTDFEGLFQNSRENGLAENCVRGKYARLARNSYAPIFVPSSLICPVVIA